MGCGPEEAPRMGTNSWTKQQGHVRPTARDVSLGPRRWHGTGASPTTGAGSPGPGESGRSGAEGRGRGRRWNMVEPDVSLKVTR